MTANVSAEAWAAATAAGAELVEGCELGAYVHRYDDSGDAPAEMVVQEARHAARSRGLGIAADDRGLRIVCVGCGAPVSCSSCRCEAP